ncbi:MAG: hypothetical protein WCK21_09450, partial [Actinomycetota bacterium]
MSARTHSSRTGLSARRTAGRVTVILLLLGAASADRVFGALTARRTGRTAAVTTEDGSMGVRGLVTRTDLPLKSVAA